MGEPRSAREESTGSAAAGTRNGDEEVDVGAGGLGHQFAGGGRVEAEVPGHHDPVVGGGRRGGRGGHCGCGDELHLRFQGWGPLCRCLSCDGAAFGGEVGRRFL